jgi:hypothetical protein
MWLPAVIGTKEEEGYLPMWLPAVIRTKEEEG